MHVMPCSWQHQARPWAKFPADAVQTPDDRKAAMSLIEAMALAAGRTLKELIGCRFS